MLEQQLVTQQAQSSVVAQAPATISWQGNLYINNQEDIDNINRLETLQQQCTAEENTVEENVPDPHLRYLPQQYVSDVGAVQQCNEQVALLQNELTPAQ